MGAQMAALMSLTEVADSLRVSKHTVRSWVAKGRLRPVRICRRLLFDQIEIAAFVERGTSASGDAR
jgi:excisionase family DNA binding protein